MLLNAGVLYVRMLLVVGLSLYASRLLLDVLGVSDFGVYHVIAAMVTLLGFMQGAMTAATQRFFAYDIGKSDGLGIGSLLATSVAIHALIALLIVLLAETAGLWFVKNQLSIPPMRASAAVSAYHLVVLGFAVTVMTIPFAAVITAHERIAIYSVIGILDAALKLAAIFMLRHFEADHLILYSLFLMIVSALTLLAYVSAAKSVLKKHGPLVWRVESQIFGPMLGYTAWNVWGNLASALSGQGVMVLLNVFFGPVVNSARVISVQANGALNNFVANIQAATNPRIIKLYASGDAVGMHHLVMKASKYSFFVLFTLALPVMTYTDQLLDLWLVDVPEYSAELLQLAIIASLIDSFAGPLMASAQATGRIRAYQLIIGGILLMTIPIAYLSLISWRDPRVALVVVAAVSLVAFVARLFVLRRLTGIDVTAFIRTIILRSILTGAGIVLVIGVLPLPEPVGIRELIVNVLIVLGLAVVGVLVVGLNSTERAQLVSAIRSLNLSQIKA